MKTATSLNVSDRVDSRLRTTPSLSMEGIRVFSLSRIPVTEMPPTPPIIAPRSMPSNRGNRLGIR